MPGGNIESDADPQDAAEIFDEDNYNTDEQLNEMRTFEEMPDVLDVTTARGDRDDDEAMALDADEFDPEAFDDEIDLEEDHELDYRASGEDEGEDAARLGRGGAESPTELATGADPSEDRLQGRLDTGLEQTFPASDPVSITRRGD
jgi:hypothetical protein